MGMTENDWLELLPEVLSFKQEPDLIPGDLIVFEYLGVNITEDEIRWAESTQSGPDPVKVPTKTRGTRPATYLTITAVRRNIKGRWIAEYVATGIEDPAFMAKVGGRVTASRLSIDPDAEIMEPPAKESSYMDIRAMKVKRDRLAAERTTQRGRLMRTSSPISARLIPAMIEKLDRQISELDAKIESESIAA
jgi:hypothetical protein